MENITHEQMDELADCSHCELLRHKPDASNVLEHACRKHRELLRYILMMHHLGMMEAHLRRIQELGDL